MDTQLETDARPALEAAILGLAPDWIVMANLVLDGERADYLLLHPRRGVALVDCRERRGDPVAALRALLVRERFEEFFPGRLPIVHFAIAGTGDRLAQRLDKAFMGDAPLTLGDADWVDAVSLLITAHQAPQAWIVEPAPAEPAAEPAFARTGPAEAGEETAGEDDPPAPAPYLGPRLPRWQSVAAVLSLSTFALLWFLLPGETPGHLPAIRVAVAPTPQTPAPPPVAEPSPVPSASVPIEAPEPSAPPEAPQLAVAPPAPDSAAPPLDEGTSAPPAQVATGEAPPPPEPEAHDAAVADAAPVPPAIAPTEAPESPAPAEAPQLAEAPPIPATALPAAPPAAIAEAAPAPAPNTAAPPPAEGTSAPPAQVATGEASPAPEPEARDAAVPPHPPAAPERPRAQPPKRLVALPPLETRRVTERPVPAMLMPPAVAGRRQALLEEASPHRQVTPVADLIHRNCRPYSSSTTLLGARQDVAGLACQAKDGSWQLVSEAPVNR